MKNIYTSLTESTDEEEGIVKSPVDENELQDLLISNPFNISKKGARVRKHSLMTSHAQGRINHKVD